MELDRDLGAQMFAGRESDVEVVVEVRHCPSLLQRRVLDEVEHLAADVSAVGFSMLSFQPAAQVGDERRWTGGDCRTVGIDDVWDRLVPACVQHSVIDPGENERLRQLLPLMVLGSGSRSA